jgi:hypothetical protein
MGFVQRKVLQIFYFLKIKNKILNFFRLSFIKNIEQSFFGNTSDDKERFAIHYAKSIYFAKLWRSIN